MSHFSWETEGMDQVQVEQQVEVEPRPEPLPDQVQQAQAPVADLGALALSVDDFSALEERILRAVNLVKRERLARAEAEERAAKSESRLAEQTPQIDQMQTELNTLRAERDHVRQRVERLLSQLDALEL